MSVTKTDISINNLVFLNKIIMTTTILNNTRIVQKDGMINLTALCQAGGKLFKNWYSNNRTKEFLSALSTTTNIPIDKLLVYKNVEPTNKATWGHPLVATNIAQWISVDFGIKVSLWLEQWKSQRAQNLEEYNSALEHVRANTKTNSREREIQLILAQELPESNIEVNTPIGRIDIEWRDEIIEVKHISKWKHAIGQIQAYQYYINKPMRIHLYDTDDNVDMSIVQTICSKHNIRLTHSV